MSELNSFRSLRIRSGMTLTDMSKFFSIPLRTIQHWDAGDRDCPPYLLKLMEESLIFHGIIKE